MKSSEPIHAATQAAIRRRDNCGLNVAAIAKDLGLSTRDVLRVLRPPMPKVSDKEATNLRRQMRKASSIKNQQQRLYQQTLLLNNFGDLMPEWTM